MTQPRHGVTRGGGGAKSGTIQLHSRGRSAAPVAEALLSAHLQPRGETGAAPGQLLAGGPRLAFERPWASAFWGVDRRHRKRWMR